MSRFGRSPAAAGGLALAVALVSSASASAAVPSKTTPLARGLAPVQVAGATAAGVLSASHVPVTLVLKPRDAAGLDALVASPHAPLSSSEFNARYAPSQATVDAVTSWAQAAGLDVTSVAANRLLVRLSGSPAAVGSAFGVKLVSFKLTDGTTYYTPSGTAQLPAAISSLTRSVLGLSSLGRMSTPQPKHASAKPAAGSSVNFPSQYGPQDFWTLYNAPSGVTGSGQALSVIAEGDLTQPKKDLATFEAQFGLPAVAWNQITVGTPTSDTSGDDEWDLDTQYSTGFAPGVTTLNVYDGPSLSNDDIAATINRWVSDNSTRQASFSAGECEVLAFATGFTDALDTILEQAVAQGQTLFTSSGDTGSFCPAVVGVNGVPAGLPSDNYPASSPFAMGVGGTTVLGSGPTEVSWYAGGGGTSDVEAAPAYQQNAGGSFVPVNRGVPDVALDGDPNSGYRVIVAGQEETIGGTSAGAPSWQGIWARAQSAHGGTLGFAGAPIYDAPATAFNDITLGTNGLYPTTPGWDYNTGRGTPNITALVNGA
jgi:pseudomonalisin